MLAWPGLAEADPPGVAVHVAAANAVAGDARGAELLRGAVASGPPRVVARGLAALKIPGCPLVAEQMPEEWESYVKQIAPPPVEPGSFGLGRELVQQETRMRLLQLFSEGTDGDCLAFVAEIARDKSKSEEERALARTILRPASLSGDELSLADLDARLASRNVQVGWPRWSGSPGDGTGLPRASGPLFAIRTSASRVCWPG
jgi:hypothetical protein